MNNNIFTTTDTSLAVYLYLEGYRITDIDYTQPRAEIYFKDHDDSIQERQRLYYIGKSTVDPSAYSRIHKTLSRIIRTKTVWSEGVLNA